MADGDEPGPDEGDIGPPRRPEPTEELQLRVRVTGVQGLSESDGPITVAYTFDANEFAADSEEVVEPVPIAGETEPPEEGGAVQKIDFVKDHKLAPVGHKGHEDMLLNLVTKQFKFTVTGTVGEGDFKGLFDVDTKELIWRDHPDPDEDDDKKKDYPFINGDFEVKRVGEETEDGSPNLTDSSLKVSLCIELSDYVMTVEEGEQSNVMTIVVEEMHNLPKAWSLEEGDEGGDEHAFAYRANYAFPSMNGGIKEVTAQPGKMVPATPPASQPEGEGAGEGDEEQDVVQQQQKFPSTDQEPEPEIAVLQHTLREVDVNKEKKAQRVAWHHEFTSFMSPSVIKDFADALRKGTKFAVDLKRIYKDEDKDYIYAAKYHGKSEMDLSKILEEDTTSITVRSPVGPAASQLPPLTEEEAPDAPDAEKDQVLQDNHITAPYLLYETYLVVTVSTTRPIVKRPPAPPPVLDSVSSLLPKRTPVPAYRPQTDGEEDYRSELRNIIVDMTEAYLKLQDNLEGDSSNPENVKNAQKEMMLHLASKSVGKWHDFKVKLKTAVLKVINERCHQLSFGGVEMDAADEIGKLNTFLRDEMNEALAQAFEAKKSFNDEPSLAVLQTLLDEELRLAFEAEVRMDYRSACVHLAKRIVATKDDPDDDLKATLWYDLGTVTCRAGDDEKAEECFRKAINFQSKHINANMALGTLLCKRDNYKEADQYFRRASDGTSDVMAWSCFGVFCDLDAKEQDRKACFKQLAQAEKKTGAIKKSPYLRAGSFFVELYATQLVERAMTQEFMRNPGGEMDTYESWETTPNSTEELKVLLGKAYLCNKQFAKARMHLDDAMARARDKNSAVALCLKGHTHYLEQNWHLYRCDRAIPKNAGFPYPYEKIPSKQTVSIDEFYSKAMMAKPPFIDIEQYYRLARLLIASEPPKLPAAQKQLIEACKLQPSATTWLGLAVAYYHDKKYVEAEHACAEAIILDVHNGEAWGMTCLIALRQILELPEPENENSPGAIQLPDGRLVDVEFPPKLKEASEAISRAFAENLGVTESYPRKHFILEEVAELFSDQKICCYDFAAGALRQALASVPDVMETRVRISDIIINESSATELRKGVDTVVLSKMTNNRPTEIDLFGLINALQESQTDPQCVQWEFVDPHQRAMMPETAKRISFKLASACERQAEPDYDSALDAYDKAWQVAFVCGSISQHDKDKIDYKTKSFESIKAICDKIVPDGLDRKKKYIARMKPPTRKGDTRKGTTAASTAK